MSSAADVNYYIGHFFELDPSMQREDWVNTRPWPLHVTVLPRLAVAHEYEQPLLDFVEHTSRRYLPIAVVFEGKETFGPNTSNEYVQVYPLTSHLGQLSMLHNDLHDFVDSVMGRVDSYYVRERYNPHATAVVEGLEGSTGYVDSLTVIKRQSEQPDRILGQYRLQGDS